MEQTKTSKLVSVLLAFVLSFSMLGTASLGIFAETAYAADETPDSIVLTTTQSSYEYPVSKLVLFNGDSTDINATVLGTDGNEFKVNNKSVSVLFESDNVNQVSVDDNGLIVAHAVTSSPVTITASYEGVTTSCEVEVAEFAFNTSGQEFIAIKQGATLSPYTSTFKWDNDKDAGTSDVIVDFEGSNSSANVDTDTDYESLTYLKAVGEVTFSSDNENVVKVDKDGVLTVKGPGVATVSAAVQFTYRNQACNKVAKSVVVVTNPPKTVTLTPSTTIYLNEGKDFTITAEVVGDLTDDLTSSGKALALNDDTTYTWSSNKEGVVSFSSTGGSTKTTVTALKPGKINVTCTAQSGTLKAKSHVTLVVNGLGISHTTLNFTSSELGNTNKKEIFVALYEGASSSALTSGVSWKSSDVSVATVDGTGRAHVTAVGPGTATVTATYKDGDVVYTASCVVTVNDPISAITAEVDKPKTSNVYGVGDKGTLTATLVDSNNNNPSLSQAGGTIRWVSSDASVVAVSGNGEKASFEVLKPGKATIKAIYNSGAEDADDVESTVTNSPTTELLAKGIAVDPGSVTLSVDKKSTTLSIIEVTAAGAADEPAYNPGATEWFINEGGEDVIRINGAPNVGKKITITAIGGGTATVTAEYKNEKSVVQTATCEVTVKNPATAISVDPAQVTLDEGAASQLTASTEGPLGTKVTDTITWASSDKKVATIDGSGLVTAVGAGSATITATAGSVSATCAVTVNAVTPESVTMYRLYNPNSGEHFFTVDAAECEMLVNAGWDKEDNGAPVPTTGKAVYRLYNQYGGEHHYTLDEGEVAALVNAGWTDEGVKFYSADETGTPVYRVYNPNAFANNHHYTPNENEKNYLVTIGWKGEGIGWYGV